MIVNGESSGGHNVSNVADHSEMAGSVSIVSEGKQRGEKYVMNQQRESRRDSRRC